LDSNGGIAIAPNSNAAAARRTFIGKSAEYVVCILSPSILLVCPCNRRRAPSVLLKFILKGSNQSAGPPDGQHPLGKWLRGQFPAVGEGDQAIGGIDCNDVSVADLGRDAGNGQDRQAL